MMSNIKNFNFNKLDLKLSNSDYWDFYLANDESAIGDCSPLLSGDCSIVWYDFNNINIYSGITNTISDIHSILKWNNATNTGYTFDTIGLTGIDNGLILFDKQSGDTANLALLSALSGTTLVIPSGDTRLHLKNISGTTGEYVYPMRLITDSGMPMIGNFINLYGGFYQGYYKIDGSTYEVLPTRVNHSWSSEFWLTRNQFSATTTGQTLNDLYPENNGIFFYMGTRAENKFWNKWEGSDTGCTVNCTQPTTACTDTISEWCTIPKESEITIVGDYGIGISLDPPRTEIDLITNGFLIYGRAYDGRHSELTGLTVYNPTITATTSYYCHRCGFNHDGLGTQTACSYDGNGIAVANIRKTITNSQNPFLIYGRGSGRIYSGTTCCVGPNDGLGSQTAYSYSGSSTNETEIDYKVDILDNALGFRIKEDGSIGYRLMTVTGSCDASQVYTSGTTIQEEYSEPNLINDSDWFYIVIKFVTNYQDDCTLESSKQRMGRLKFYVNGFLRFVVDDFPEFIGKRLDENKSKQVGVPFNISLGGGSQGLLESQTFGGIDLSDRGLPIEKNFAGSFIGGISQFKFNICEMSLCQIRAAYNLEAIKYGNQII